MKNPMDRKDTNSKLILYENLTNITKTMTYKPIYDRILVQLNKIDEVIKRRKTLSEKERDTE